MSNGTYTEDIKPDGRRILTLTPEVSTTPPPVTTPPPDPGYQRPDLPEHMDDMLGAKMVLPPKSPDKYDFESRDYPRHDLSETQNMSMTPEQATLYDSISGQYIANKNLKGIQDAGVTVVTHHSVRGLQNYNHNDEHHGMAFQKLGTYTIGTHDDGTMSPFAFLYTAATKLTEQINSATKTIKVTNASEIKPPCCVLINQGGLADLHNRPELCVVKSKSGNTLHLEDYKNGNTVIATARGYNCDAISHPGGAYIRAVCKSATGHPLGFAHNFSTDPSQADTKGRTPMEALIKFDVDNYDKDKYGRDLPGYKPKGILRDVHLRHIPSARKCDYFLECEVGKKVATNGWKGRVNQFGLDIDEFAEQIEAKLPHLHHNAGYEGATRPESYTCDQMETITAGQKGPTSGFGAVDGAVCIMDNKRHHTRYQGWNIVVSKHPDPWFPYTESSDGIPASITDYNINRFHWAMCQILGWGFGRQNIGGHEAKDKLPVYPEFYIRDDGRMMDHWNRGDSIANCTANRGYLGQPLGAGYRVINNADWAEETAETVIHPDDGWVTKDCVSKVIDGKRTFSGWAKDQPYDGMYDAQVNSPPVPLEKGDYYTCVITDVEGDASRAISVGFVNNEVQPMRVPSVSNSLIFNFQAESDGNERLLINCGLENVLFSFGKVLLFKGQTTRTWRRDFEGGSVIASWDNQPVQVKLGCQMLLPEHPDLPQYTGKRVSDVQIHKDGLVLLA